MNIDSKVQIGLLLLAGVGTAFTVGLNLSDERTKVLEAQLDQIEDIRASDIPEITAELKKTLKEMNERIDLQNRVKSLEETNTSLAASLKGKKEELASAQSELTVRNRELSEAKRTIEEWDSEVTSVTVKGKESELVGKEKVSIGVKRVNTETAEVTINGKTQELHAGSVVMPEGYEPRIQIIVSKIDYLKETVSFDLIRR